MIDVDPQGCLGHLLGRKDDEWAGLADLLMGRVTQEQAIKRSNIPLLSLMPRGRLDPADVGEFERSVRNPKVLKAALRNLERRYDVILLDIPPGIGLVPRGALSVVDEVIVTARTEPMAARSLGRLFTVLDLVRKHENGALAVTGVLPTFYDERNAISQSLLTAMQKAGVPLFDASIPQSELFIRASERGQPLRRFVGIRSAELKPVEVVADVIAARVKGEDPPESAFQSLAPQPPGRYLRFSGHRFREREPIRVDAEEIDQAFRVELNQLAANAPFGIEEWHDFLDTCICSCGAETAFVTDSEGLIVASRGRLHAAEMEGIGTRLSIAFQQADRMEIAAGDSQSVLIEFDHLWLSGVGFRADDRPSFTIGILGKDPIPAAMRNEIRETMRSLTVGFTDAGDTATDETWVTEDEYAEAEEIEEVS
jgi:chromosome partitioning protein